MRLAGLTRTFLRASTVLVGLWIPPTTLIGINAIPLKDAETRHALEAQQEEKIYKK
jgi:hypothetical protein